jgi:hypothetical protein
MTKCKFCNECKKPVTIMGPICGYCKKCKKKPIVIMETICRYCKEYKMSATIMGLICEYCNECKMTTAILGLICGYCIFENLFMEFIIENDVGIICVCIVLKVFR